MAPIHHHFELIGWKEPKIIVRFWILTFIFVLIGLSVKNKMKKSLILGYGITGKSLKRTSQKKYKF